MASSVASLPRLPFGLCLGSTTTKTNQFYLCVYAFVGAHHPAHPGHVLRGQRRPPRGAKRGRVRERQPSESALDQRSREQRDPAPAPKFDRHRSTRGVLLPFPLFQVLFVSSLLSLIYLWSSYHNSAIISLLPFYLVPCLHIVGCKKVHAKGELQLGILIEEMRREKYEMCVSPPRILTVPCPETGDMLEPIEEVTIDVDQVRAMSPLTFAVFVCLQSYQQIAFSLSSFLFFFFLVSVRTSMMLCYRTFKKKIQ